MSFRSYPSCVDSGASWLGSIPTHWEAVRLRNIFEIRKRIAGVEGYDVLSITQRGIRVRDTESNDGQLAASYANYQIVEPGDFAMNHMDLLTGWVDRSRQLGVTSPDYRVFALRDENRMCPTFALYLFQNGYTQKVFFAFGQGSSHLGRWRLPTDAFLNFIAPLPPLHEQNAIANFLDRETAKIDSLVEEQRRLIQLLKEKRQATISNAVTKGLDPTVSMTVSGVEWFAELPAAWQVLPVKRLTKLVTERADRRTFAVGLENIESWSGKLVASESDFSGNGTAFEVGDVLYGKLRPYLAKVYATKQSGEAVGDFHVLRPQAGITAAYLKYLLVTKEVVSQLNGSTHGAKMPRVSWDFLGSLPIPLPSPSEQKTIALFLDRETAKIDELCERATAAIDLLQERRAALISAAVTGKIDVREDGARQMNTLVA